MTGELANCVGNCAVASAAAQVSIKLLFNLLFGWIGVLKQHGVRVHDKTGCAVAALGSMVVDELFLNWMKTCSLTANALNGCNGGAMGLAKGHETRVDGTVFDFACDWIV